MVPVLVQLVVNHLLDDNDDGTEKEGESDDPEVGLQIPLLEGEILAEEGVGLGEEAGGTSRRGGGGGRWLHV